MAIALLCILCHATGMFIRCTTTRSKQSGDTYQTYRLVENERIQGQVKQRTLLNLGRHFDVPKSQWTELSSRISQLLSIQGSLFSLELDPELEAKAQRYAAQNWFPAARQQCPIVGLSRC